MSKGARDFLRAPGTQLVIIAALLWFARKVYEFFSGA